MPNSLTATGLTTATQSELLAQLTAAMQTIYGPDIDLSSSSPDGQLINIFIQIVLDIEDLLTQIYNTFDPDNAIGTILDQRVAVNGIQRQGGTYTVQPVSITVSQAVTLPGVNNSSTPYTVADAAGNQYQLQEGYSFTEAGTESLSFVAVNPGSVSSALNSITTPVTVVLGVTGINNPSTYSTLGINEETDAALRIRRQQSVALSSQGYLSGLEAALNNISGIGSVSVIENDTDGMVNDVPGHSIWVIVGVSPAYPTSDVSTWSSVTTYSVGQLALYNGIVYASGTNNNTGNMPPTSPESANSSWWEFDQVAWAIYLKRNSGCGMYSAEDNNVAVTQIDGSQFIVSYGTVQTENLYIAFYASALAANTVPDYVAIQSEIVESFTPGVNQEVNINALIVITQAADPNTLITFSGSGTPATGGFSTAHNGTYSNTLTPSAANKQFTISAGQIIMLPGLLSPSAPSVNTTATQQFSVLGLYSPNQATSDFTWTVTVNNSGSPGCPNGLYTAGSTSGVTDTIQAEDSLGNVVTTNITVT